GKIDSLLNDDYKGYSGMLSKSEKACLDNHLDQNTYLRTQDIVSYVSKEFKVEYSLSGMKDLLHRFNYFVQEAEAGAGKGRCKCPGRICRILQGIKEN
ncbi:MAG: winged helix-turn-helix domain-containing protein, partial [Planctomycetota bacterium]